MATPGRGWFSGWKLNLAMSPLWAFLIIKLVSVFGLFQLADMHFSLTDWRLGPVGLVERPDQPVLLIEMENDPPGWGIAYERLVALDPQDGSMLGQVLEGGALYLIGLTTDEAWLTTGWGKGRDARGYVLPGLDLRYDLEGLLGDHPLGGIVDRVAVDGPGAALRIRALDGHQYRLVPETGEVERLPLDPPPPAPDLLDGWRTCRFAYRGPLFDHRGCRPIRIGGRALAIRSVHNGKTRYWHIRRPGDDGKPVWEVTDRDLFGALADDAPLRNIRYLTLHRGKIVLVAEDGDGVDDVYAAAIDTQDGRILWTRTFW